MFGGSGSILNKKGVILTHRMSRARRPCRKSRKRFVKMTIFTLLFLKKWQKGLQMTGDYFK